MYCTQARLSSAVPMACLRKYLPKIATERCLITAMNRDLVSTSLNQRMSNNTFNNMSLIKGCGCGTVGRVVTSNTKDHWFESSHRQILFTLNCITMIKIKEKEAAKVQIFNLKKIKIRKHSWTLLFSSFQWESDCSAEST